MVHRYGHCSPCARAQINSQREVDNAWNCLTPEGTRHFSVEVGLSSLQPTYVWMGGGVGVHARVLV